MATIPIEIILQDAESPVTPTPESGEETNITVPDTGTISDGGSNSGGIGSSASIILPAIIAVLALGAMVAILIHKHRKHQNDKLSKKEKFATAASGTIAILAATVLVGNLVIPATKAATSVEPGTAELDTVDKITITATREIDSDITIATVKNTSYATANLDFGYKVTASMAEGTATANLYLDGNTDSGYYIAPVVDGTLTDNAWGYTLEEPNEDATYLPIPLEDTPATITKGNDMVEDEAVDIYYSIKVDKDMPAGRYIGELEYTLTDNNFPATLTTMQGMTTEICENTFTPGNQVTDPVPTATLEDIRDHNTYTIAKLADGKCWMTQNLDLDLSTATTLTPADTDVSEDWTPSNSTIVFTGTSVSEWRNSETAPRSADPGDVYYYTSGTNASDTKYDSLAECEREHSDDSCQHYHAGNYYNWSAAVASNDTSETTEPYSNAPDSICPAGWRLLTGPGADETHYNEMSSLIRSYPGILEELQSDIYNYTASGFRAVRTKPLWSVRAGYVYYGGLNEPRISGNYWTSTSFGLLYGSNRFYLLTFEVEHLDPTNKAPGDYGYSVRCVAR